MIELTTDTLQFIVKWLRLLFFFSPAPCHVSLLRLSRLLKWHSVETFFFLSDYRTSKPNRLRAFKLILYLSVAMHWVACLYYTISEYEGLGTNDWVYTETEEGGDRFIRSALKITYINTSYLTLGPFCKLRTEFFPLRFMVQARRVLARVLARWPSGRPMDGHFKGENK